MAQEPKLLPFMMTPHFAMRSPSPQLAGSKRDSSGEILGATTWKKHMVENFGCQIETAECQNPICVNPQHLLVNSNLHNDLHRHSACVPPSATSAGHVQSCKRPSAASVSDICTEKACLSGDPETDANYFCDGIFLDSCSTSPTCTGDEACTIPDSCCVDPDCDLTDVCWDNLCTDVDCDQAPCPDGLCLVDEVCFKEPCPRASAPDQASCVALEDQLRQSLCSAHAHPPHLIPGAHGEPALACSGAHGHFGHGSLHYHGWMSADASMSHQQAHCLNNDGSYGCHVPHFHINGNSHAPACYMPTNMNGQLYMATSALEQLSQSARHMANNQNSNRIFEWQAATSQYDSTPTLEGSFSGSSLSSPVSSFPTHGNSDFSFKHAVDSAQGTFMRPSSPLGPPAKRFHDDLSYSRFNFDTLPCSTRNDFGVARSVETAEHTCLWTIPVKSEDQMPVLCNKKFRSAKDLADHMKEEHTEGIEGKYCCQWQGCPSSTDFKQSGKLARHFAIHSKYKRFQCKFCDKSFNTAQTLENHHNTHTGERPHICHYEGCTYAAATATQLKGHIQGTHLKEKRFQCKLCDFCCTDSSNLTKHENGVHGRKEYRCPHAGCDHPVTDEWSQIRKHFKESGHCPELLESNSQAQKRYKKAAVVKDQATVMANGRRAPISRNRTRRSETVERKGESESSMEPVFC
ncbi:uncharacterized protein J3D65DRAFT_626614 [Phyllosticta citribraziliensis]|uniref:C2H2-type domain-containing protein n=1 Tax=Phyllosticta citribraziliensis TaxID=989973 RepID=A0ABR1LL17_9PEZI